MQGFQNLKVWQKAHHNVLAIYKITASFPDEEKFGLVSQMRRAASSVPANIVEGSLRGSDADYARFLQMSLASNGELSYHILLARDLGFIDKPTYDDLSHDIEIVGRMLNNFIKKLRSKS